MNGELPHIHVAPINRTNPNDFFSIFFKEQENDLVGCGPIQPYPAATEIFRDVAPVKFIYLIERGMVKLSRMGHDGTEVIVGLCSRYCLLATPALFLKTPYTVTATTLTPCHLRCITAKCLYNLLKTDKTFSWEMYRHLSELILDNFRKIEEVSHMSAEERLRTFLGQLIVELCPEKAETGNHYQVPLRQHEVAEIIGVSPEHLCRLEKKMQQEGIVISTKGMLTIHDVSRLFP